MNNRMKSAIGLPITEATELACGPIGSPLVTAAPACPVRVAEPNSRREAANTAHANGPAAEPSPPPEANHDRRFEPTPRTTPPATVADGAAVAAATREEAFTAAAGIGELSLTGEDTSGTNTTGPSSTGVRPAGCGGASTEATAGPETAEP